ncbi:hypothetical protein C9926_00555 [Sulfurovum lithotrophicum]|nr:hypothetical protein C9926_00555 [Sulfurovum lithotrophicum]
MKYLIVIYYLFFSAGVWAEGTALFASVVKLAENDTLNVRAEANYKAKKVGEIPSEWHMGVEKCTQIKSSTWCYVYPLVQIWSDNFGPRNEGWVNARYLHFSNHGYVIVKGKKECAYALGCHDNKCEVVIDFVIIDIENNILNLKKKWIDRQYLKAESNFGVSPDDVDGVCNSRMIIEQYLTRQAINP